MFDAWILAIVLLAPGGSSAPDAPAGAPITAPATEPGVAAEAALTGTPADTSEATAQTAPALDGATLLRRVDAANQRAEDADFTLQVSVREGDGPARERTLRIWQKGARRMVKFLAPPRLRGTGILAPEPGRISLYLPAYRRVRPVVGRAAGDSFVGTDFSIDDLARVRFSDDYRATLRATHADRWELLLTPRVPEEMDHAQLHLWVRRADDNVARMELRGADGALQRTVELSDFRTVGAYSLAHRITAHDHRRGRRTDAQIGAVRFDQGLADDFFSERFLTREP